MLSRVADSLFWMGLYVERAENIARIVDVNSQLMLDLPREQADRISRNWMPVVASLGDERAFRERHKKADAEAVTDFLLFDRSHTNSIVGSLAAARENARTVREQISTEMWEQINRTYLWLTSKGSRQFFHRNAYEFFERTKKSLQLFQGITDSVMMQGEGWEFLRMGRYLERADKASRLLDDEFFLVKGDGKSNGTAVIQWQAILRCSNARQAYQRLYATVVEPIRVAELLLLHEEFPRSVEHCLRGLDQALRRMSGVSSGKFSNQAEKLSGRLLSELSFGSIEEIWQRGLHQAMDDLQLKLNAIGAAIRDVYINPAVPVAAMATAATAQVPQ
ncbi:MAG TPA: alpha-E domain-containing protein [Verrucomicrobiales bacterium]|nr:alpha-E domain-containing protein [Verrucomicrobiales bacterium]